LAALLRELIKWDICEADNYRGHIGIGKNNGNTTNTAVISLLICCWTTFTFSTAGLWFGWTRISFEQSLDEFYTILVAEYLQVALKMLEVGIGFSFYSPKLTRVVQWYSNLVTVLAREDGEVHIHVLQAVTEQFQLCEWGHCRLRNWIAVRE
jgi:hypothetical protein